MFVPSKAQEKQETTSLEDRSVFFIPEPNYTLFEQKIAKIARKAAKLTGDDFKPVIVGHHFEKVKDAEIQIFEVFLNVDVPKVDGWTFVARIEHESLSSGNNLVFPVPNTGVVLPKEYHNAKCNCDHCGHNRYRKMTYVLVNDETGEFKQVGSTCLKDFFGHDPKVACARAEFLFELDKACKTYRECGEVSADWRWINVREYLAIVNRVIEKEGWLSRSMIMNDREGIYDDRESTASVAESDYHRSYTHPLKIELYPVDYDMAERAIAWAIEKEAASDGTNDYLRNIAVIAKSDHVSYSGTGYAASIVGSYRRELDKARKTKFDPKLSEFENGVPDAKKPNITRLPEQDVVLISEGGFPNAFGGNTYVYTFATEAGNALVWFSSNNMELVKGNTYKLSGTIKKHRTFKGNKQTVVTRCKIHGADA